MSAQEHSFDNSQLPDWAIHSEREQEELSAFFNVPADRGEAETAFTIPRGTHGYGSQTIPAPAQVVATEEVDNPTQNSVEEDNELTKQAPAPAQPRREDFARFRCIYESKDGQLALYEDEQGHLSAVNTNRFI